MVKSFFKKSKFILFCLFLLIFSRKHYAQFIDTPAIENIIVADSLFDKKDYKNAILFYKKTEKRSLFPKNEIYEMISLSHYYLSEKDSALEYMVKSIDLGKHYWTENLLKGDKITLTILSHDTTGIYLQHLESNTNKFLNSHEHVIYKNLSDSLVVRKLLDQKYRTIGKKKTRKEWKKQKDIDYENKLFLFSIIKKINSWPGYKEVGREGESACYLFTQHSEDSIFQKKCLYLMHPAALVNNMNPSHYGYLLDRYLLITKGYQVFGTQIEMVKKGDKSIAQLKKNNLFNRRYAKVLRSYFTMPPLQFYLDQMTELNKNQKK